VAPLGKMSVSNPGFPWTWNQFFCQLSNLDIF